jgi:hypothetical protein
MYGYLSHTADYQYSVKMYKKKFAHLIGILKKSCNFAPYKSKKICNGKDLLHFFKVINDMNH